jgi:hypothetical protein
LTTPATALWFLVEKGEGVGEKAKLGILADYGPVLSI